MVMEGVIDKTWFDSQQENEIFISSKTYTCCGAQTVSYSMGNEHLSSEVRWPRREAEHYLLLVPRWRNGLICTSVPHKSSWQTQGQFTLPTLCYEDRSLMQIPLDPFQGRVLILAECVLVLEVCPSILAYSFLIVVFVSVLKAFVFLSTHQVAVIQSCDKRNENVD